MSVATLVAIVTGRGIPLIPVKLPGVSEKETQNTQQTLLGVY